MGLALLLVVGGCKPSKPDAEEQRKEARARATASESVAAERARESGAQVVEGPAGKGLTDEQRKMGVARIGDFVITLGDVERQLAQQPSFSRARFASFDKKVEFLNHMIQFELLAMEAKKKGYDSDPDVVLAMKRAMTQKFTQTDLQALVTVSTIDEAEVKTYYENNKPLFIQPERVRASHIQFATQAEAERVLAELKAAIATDTARARVIFGEFARRNSKDTATAGVSGDLEQFGRDGYRDEVADATGAPGTGARPARLHEKLVEAAFALEKPNDLSPIVQTDAGFHVVQLTGRKPAVNRTLDDARRQITNTLLREKKDKARDDYIKGLRTKANVTIDEKALEGLDTTAIKDAPPSPGVMPLPGAVPSLAPLAPPPVPTPPTEPGPVPAPSGVLAPRNLQRLADPRATPTLTPRERSAPPIDPRALPGSTPAPSH